MFRAKPIFIVLIVVFIIGLLIYLKPVSKNEKDFKGKPGKKPKTVVTAYVCKGELLRHEIESSGNVLAFQSVDVVSEVSGKVVGIMFDEGSRVQKNQVLVKIYDKDLQVQLKKLVLEKELIEKNEARQKQLLAIHAISQQEYDLILNQLHTVLAEMDAIKYQIEKTEIRAPFSGFIGLKDIEEGSYVSPNYRIASLQNTDELKVDFSIPERYLSMVHTGMNISFMGNGSADTMQAVIYAMEPRIDLQTRTLQIRAKYNNLNKKILPGSFVKIKLKLSDIENAVMIPTESIIPQLKGQKVFLSKSGKAFSQNIETGIRTDARVQIVDGLQAGDTLITTGIMQLKPGMDLEISKIE